MKKIIITGGTGAIGAALVEEFSQDFEVILTYFNNKEKADELCCKYGVRAYKCDVSDKSAVERLLAAENNFDALINNAGISQIKMFQDITDFDWDNMLGVNLTGAFNMCKAVLPYMISKKSGAIINISSIWGITGASCEVHYSAAKAGLIGFTKALAKETGPSGIRVNCIAPGVISSPMNDKLGEEALDELKNSAALVKLGKPKDIAEAARYFIKAEFVTGQVLTVDGGFI